MTDDLDESGVDDPDARSMHFHTDRVEAWAPIEFKDVPSFKGRSHE